MKNRNIKYIGQRENNRLQREKFNDINYYIKCKGTEQPN